jgi:D-threo-aldose 1-dehydrogenase
MGIDRIDVLHIHDPEQDYPTSSTDALRALAELRGRGTIGAVSLGVNHADVAARFLRDTGADGPDVVLLAGRYTLLDQSGAEELLPLCEKLGVAVLAAGVFQGGVLAEGAPHGQELPADLVRRIDRLREVCGRWDVPLLAAAVQFPLAHPAVPAVVVGARSPQEITEVAGWMDHEIPAAFWRELERH